jgi:uncharacterized cupredoxin-like copper-binding protein
VAGARRDGDHPGRGVAAARDGGQIGRARGRALPALAALAVASAIAAAGAQAGAPATSAAAGTHLQVTEIEYRLMLSEAVVRAGPVDLEAIDAGMDPHDLRLRHGRSPVSSGAALLSPGQRFDGVVNLRPGTYHLWCSLAGHWKLGMHATLRVVR